MQTNNVYDNNFIDEDSFKNLDKYVDNFVLIHDVNTRLLYGTMGDCNNIFLSVIIPTFNRNDSFRRALQSVLYQNPDCLWEVIVVDNTPFDENGSTPALEIVRLLSDVRVNYYHNDINIGSGYNWNRGVEIAKGKWVCFLHDDDTLEKGALNYVTRLINKLEKKKLGKPLGYIHAKRRYCYADNNIEENSDVLNNDTKIKILSRFKTLLVGYTGTGAPSCGTTILRKAYIESGGINYNFGPVADAVLGYQIMNKYTVVESGKVLGCYNWGSNETIKPDTVRKLVYADYLFQKYREQKNIFTKLWGKLFGRVQFNRNVDIKINLYGLKAGAVTREEFNYLMQYKRSSFVLRNIYDVIVKCCGWIIDIRGMMWGKKI